MTTRPILSNHLDHEEVVEVMLLSTSSHKHTKVCDSKIVNYTLCHNAFLVADVRVICGQEQKQVVFANHTLANDASHERTYGEQHAADTKLRETIVTLCLCSFRCCQSHIFQE